MENNPFINHSFKKYKIVNKEHKLQPKAYIYLVSNKGILFKILFQIK